MRGDLVSRRPDAILREAEKLVAAGTKELLVISQDTSAYGVDLQPRRWPWKGGEVRAHMTDLARELGKLGAWVRLHYVYPYPHVDQVIPLMAEGLILPYLDIPFQHASPQGAEGDEAPGQRGEGARADPRAGARSAPTSRSARPSSSASRARPRRISTICWTGSTRRSSTGSARSASSRSRAPRPTPARHRAGGGQGRALRPPHGEDRRDLAPRSSRPRSAARST